MSLAVRLLVALSAVAVFVTALVGFFARDAARREVEHGFDQRIAAAVNGARGELVWEAENLAELLEPLCKHDSFVDRTLLALVDAGGKVEAMPQGVGISLQRLVPEQRKALRLDRLLLVTGDGLVLASSDATEDQGGRANALKLLGTRDPSLARLVAEPPGKPHLVRRGREASMQVHCAESRGGVTLGLVGSRRVEPILERIGSAYDVTLTLATGEAPAAAQDVLERRLRIGEIPGLEVNAAISRQPLHEALAQVDASIFLTGGIAVLLSVALAVLLARGLSQPLVELAQQTREVVRGNPQPVRGRGGRELEQLARTFNRTIDELTMMRKRLARSERIAARREVARQVAHEIKNPLAPIRAAVETLRRLRDRQSPQFDEYFDEATRTVLDEVHRIKNIVSEFSKFARMPPPRFERVDLGELARGVAALHSSQDGQGPRVVLDVEPDLPEVLADRDQLVQVLTNLVQNGIEAAAPTRPDPEVVVRIAARSEREVGIAVEDNGPGIAPDVRQRLFEPYVSTKTEGTGLGLAIVQSIVHEHGGEIRAGDAEGGGALFELSLPVEGPPLLERAPVSTGVTG
jgi:signal transduction histidine kinase